MRETEIIDFFKRLQQHCKKEEEKNNGQAGCYNCCFHVFCFTEPDNMTERLVNECLSNLCKGEKVDNKNVLEFYKKLKRHCIEEKNKTNRCTFRQCRFWEFCYTPPISLSKRVVFQNLLNPEKVHNLTGL